jgi:phosphotransferase system enzyme I (PtsI)
MRAAAEAKRLGGSVRLLFPMITTVDEIRRLRRLVRRVCRDLEVEGKAFSQVPLGMMLEVPAAAVAIDMMLPLVDFVSIGSNDLVQYLMAADRDNPKVSHLCQPLAPAVLRILASVIQACEKGHTPVTLCGEMAGQPRSFTLLFGMGLRSFSMSPAFVPSIKELAQHLTVADAQQILSQALKFPTTKQVVRFMADKLAKISPNLELFETS